MSVAMWRDAGAEIVVDRDFPGLFVKRVPGDTPRTTLVLFA
jgi:hypothetical protein